MKKIIYTTLAVLAAVGLSSCSEEKLNTSPTDAVTGEGMFENATAALMPLNGVYRSMYTSGWSTLNGGNSHQCFGISAYNLAADVMGEDFIQDAQGSGWFWYDCLYDVKGMYTSGAWRPYDLWNAYYTWISNVNYIIAAKETMAGAPSDINYVIGQAYAIRAYSYFMLIQWYARTYKGHETEKGVPVYTEPTIAGTEGKGRGTVEETYAQINADIDTAIARLSNSYAQTHACQRYQGPYLHGSGEMGGGPRVRPHSAAGRSSYSCRYRWNERRGPERRALGRRDHPRPVRYLRLLHDAHG